jgi:hypothetical protein
VNRYGFGPSSHSWLAHWLSGAFCRDHLAMACGLRGQAGRVADPPDDLQSSRPRRASAGRIASGRQELPLLDRAGKTARIEIVTSAVRGAAYGRRGKRRLDFRLTMFRWQNHHSPAAVRAARVPCRDTRASDRFQDAVLAAASFPHFSISSTDAPRGAVGRPYRPPLRVFVRGERVYHGQQNDHRRLAPGRNPGGGSARQSGRGI